MHYRVFKTNRYNYITMMTGLALFVPSVAYAVGDEDMNLLTELLQKGFTFLWYVCLAMAILYWLSACVRYVAEDSDDSARKHILRAAVGVFMAASVKSIANFIIGNFFSSGLDAAPASGDAAVKEFMSILGKSITMVLYISVVLIACYWVVIAIKYCTQDDQNHLRRQLIRASIGLLLAVTASVIASWARGNFMV